MNIGQLITYNIMWIIIIWCIAILLGYIWAWKPKIAIIFIFSGLILMILSIISVFSFDSSNDSISSYNIWQNVGAIIGGFTALPISNIGRRLYEKSKK